MKIKQQLDYFNRQNMVLEEGTGEKIKNTSILVIGAGAGGNELLKNLVLMGFGNLTIIDFDYIEDSNLSKSTLFKKEDIGQSKSLVAAKRLLEYALHKNPEINGIHGNFVTDIGKGLIKDHDIIVCCVDTMNARAYINDWCVRLSKPFFEMGFENFDVNISFFCPDQDGFPVCLRENIGQGDFDSKRNSCSGYKMQDEKLAKIPTIQIAAATAGVLIATEIIKYLNGNCSLKNKTLLFYGRTFETIVLNYKRDKKCLIHNEFNIPLLDIKISKSITIKEYIKKIQDLTDDKIILTLPERFIFSANCHSCGNKIIYNKRHSLIWDDERWCSDCQNKPNFRKILDYERNVQDIYEVHENCEPSILNIKLSDLGVPYNDILFAVGVKSTPIKHYNFKNIQV